MKNKIYFIAVFLVFSFFVGFLFLSLKKNKPYLIDIATETKIKRDPIKIGLITDAHCYGKTDGTTKQWIFNWRCKEPLELFLKEMNENFKPDIVIDGGDLVDGRDDRGKENYAELLPLFEPLSMPSYHVLGNHETRSFSKGEWLELTGYQNTYYFFDSRGHRIIALDGNNKPLAQNSEESVPTSPESEYYPGMIDKKQYQWIIETLKDAKQKRLNPIVFVHQPPIITDTHFQNQLFYEGDKLRKLFSQYGVSSVFSGHIERLCALNYDGVDYFSLPGFHKENKQLEPEFQYKDGGSYYQITIAEKIKIEMLYRSDRKEPYQLKTINPEELPSCSDGSTLSPPKTETPNVKS